MIEVVVEYMPIKLDLLKKLVPNLAPGAILTTNTSGLSVNEMAAVLPAEVRKNFLATHFFNPPRYMRLMEIVPCKETDPAVMQGMADFLSKRLGKGIVYAKDTTNFIANRIGTYAIYKGIQHMVEMGMTVEEVDAIAGPATARPKSAAFRTADLVGLDTLGHVGTNSYDLLPNDEERGGLQDARLHEEDDRGRHPRQQERQGLLQKGDGERQEGSLLLRLHHRRL